MENTQTKTLKDISIAKYHEYLNIREAPFNDFDKHIRILELVEGVESGYFDSKFPKEIENLYNFIDFSLENADLPLKEYYQIGNVKYKFIREVSKLSAGQYIDLEKANSDAENRIDSLHIFLSTVLLPCRKLTFFQRLVNKTGLKLFPEVEKYGETPLEETQQNILENFNVAEANSISVFFCTLLKVFENAILIYSQALMIPKLLQALKTSNEIWQNPKNPPELRMKAKKIMDNLFKKDGIGLLQLTD